MFLVTVNQARAAGGSHGHGHSDFKYVTFDEACKPEGSWKEHNEKRQKKYNTQLVVGVSAFVLTWVAVSLIIVIYINKNY